MADAHVSEIIVTDTKDSAHVSETIVTDTEDLQSKIKTTMHSRVDYFKNQADSLTFEGVRRLLEKDLEMEIYALDVHKRFIKQCLLECLDGAGNDTTSKNSAETLENNVCLTRTESESPEDPSPKKHVKESSSKDEGMKEDSPVLGLMTGRKTTKAETEETNGSQNQEVISESMIKKAIRKREAYIRANSETVTMSALRRLLEGDLKLNKLTLDPYKKFISEEIDEVMKSPDVSETKVKKNMKKKVHSKPSKDDSSEESSHSSSGESEEVEDEVKRKKIISPKGKTKISKGIKKRKRPENETNKSSKKQIKKPDTAAEVISDAEKVSEGSDSQSSAEKPVQKKVVPTPAPGYGKRVENLRSVIKSCGMRISPAVYTKAKRAPENEREAYLIKELEEMLSREGLSKNPSEKEIKDCRKRKDRIKELEGIDMSNIVASSRRRSTTSFVPPPKPKLTVDSEEDVSEESEDDINSEDENNDDDDENNDDDDENNDDDDGDNNGDDGDANDGSESEEVEKVDDEGSD